MAEEQVQKLELSMGSFCENCSERELNDLGSCIHEKACTRMCEQMISGLLDLFQQLYDTANAPDPSQMS
ncbi:MAG: hypothetical protein VZT48_07510 [Bulleidia sp.]|nr:hypothetical protein [Bulleidia sp.]